MNKGAEKKHKLSANWAVQEVDHLITRFTRYTRYVLLGKWSLAGLALLLMIVLIVWPYFTRDTSGLRVSFTGTDALTHQPGLMPRMANPRYHSTTKAGEPFSITGAAAVQQTPTLIIIEKVTGELVKKDGSWLSLSADRAEYEQGKHTLVLQGNVNVVNDEGYNFVTPSALVDIKTMRVVGTEPISGVGPSGKLLASSFEITDNGKKVHLGGKSRVSVEINPSQP